MSSTSYPGAPPLSSVIRFPSRAVAGSPRSETLQDFETAVGIVERSMDFLAVVAAVWAACGWVSRTNKTHYSSQSVLLAAVSFGVLMVLLLEKHGGYRPCLSLLAVRETEQLLRVTVVAWLFALPVGATSAVPVKALFLATVLAPVLLALEKWQLHRLTRAIRARLGLTRNAVIVGTGTIARRIFSALMRSPRLGINPVVFVQECGPIGETAIFESGYKRKRQARVLPGPVTLRLLLRADASVLILADPEMGPEEAAAARKEAEGAGVCTYVIPNTFTDENAATEYVELDGVMLAYKLDGGPRKTFEMLKRASDIGVSAITLLLISPLLAAAAAAIKVSSSGPAIFRQQRVGRDGMRFDMYKFRTMYEDTPKYACSPIRGNDPRITRVGRLLRHLCIDELPQLVNVLRGDMSLVGPRPEMPFIVAQYEPLHQRRLAVKPGITGLWQLSADRVSPIHENISYDLYYLRHRNLLMDVAIMLHTLAFAFRGV